MWCAQVTIFPCFLGCDQKPPLQGSEHTAEVGGANSQPSHCTLAIFHAPMDAVNAPADLGYVSSDGHHFSCKKPAII